MGCWNETCGLTNLPILENESAVLVLLAIQSNITSACYTSDFAEPVALPIFGKYNSYGEVEQVTNEADVNAFLQAMHFGEVDTNLKVSINDVYELQTHLEGLSVQTWKVLRLSKVMFKRSAWDAILAHQEKTIPWREEFYAKEENRTPRNLRQVLESFFVELKQDYPLAIGLRDRSNFKMVLPAGIEPRELNNSQISALVDLMIFDSALAASRRCWQPTSGAGSQSSETSEQEFIAQLTLKLADDLRKYFEEDFAGEYFEGAPEDTEDTENTED
jgi:hypothetical protein